MAAVCMEEPSRLKCKPAVHDELIVKLVREADRALGRGSAIGSF